MITGFNTDIEHGGVVYHVQTEDKGVSTPLILSLVYNRGTILASKRSPYDDLLLPSFDEKALSERLQKQHKLICAAVRAGRIEDLKRMGKSARPKTENIAAPPAELIAEKIEITLPDKTVPSDKSEITLENRRDEATRTLLSPPLAEEKTRIGISREEIKPCSPKKSAAANEVEAKNAEPRENQVVNFPVAVVEEELIVEAIEIIEDELILAAEAVEIIPDSADENIQVVDSALKVELASDTTFRSGERKTVSINVYRGDAATGGLSGAHIMIKVFGAAFRPLIFHAKTDERGAAIVHLQVPQFKGGRAAVLVRAMSGGDEVELRRAVVG